MRRVGNMGRAGNRTGYKVFSFNTTIRNPKRNFDFLNAFKDFDGKLMTTEELLKYLIVLVRDGLYKFTNVSEEVKNKIVNNIPLTQQEINIAIDNNPQECGLNGRVMTELRALKDQGFLMFEPMGDINQITITRLGHELINQPLKAPSIYTKAMIGAEAKSPIRTTMLNKSRPFLNTLFVIREVNKQWGELGNDPKGILSHEFGAFVLSMKDCDWQQAANNIINYRNHYRYEKRWDKIDEYFRDNDILEIAESTLRDYSDEVFRKFEMTELLIKHGTSSYQYINFSEYNIEKINTILETYSNYSYIEYNTQEEYYDSLCSIQIPWEMNDLLRRRIVEAKENNIGIQPNTALSIEDRETIADIFFYKTALQKAVDSYDLDFINRELLILSRTIREKSELESISEPLRLEYLITLLIGKKFGTKGLVPNMRYSEDGKPLHYAGPGKCDIKYIHNDGAYIFEPTMVRGKDQQLNSETTNVVRHIQEERARDGIEFRASMISPIVHADVVDFFKYKIEREEVKILPLSIDRFVGLVNDSGEVRDMNNNFDEIVENIKERTNVEFADLINRYMLNENIISLLTA